MISDFMFQILQWCEICDPNEVTKNMQEFPKQLKASNRKWYSYKIKNTKIQQK